MKRNGSERISRNTFVVRATIEHETKASVFDSLGVYRGEPESREQTEQSRLKKPRKLFLPHFGTANSGGRTNLLVPATQETRMIHR